MTGSAARPIVTGGAASPIATGLAHFARARPDRPAAWSGVRSLTFAELDALAGTLAHTLLEHFPADGSGRRPMVPIVVGYDVESVIAIQAAVRAGLAHVPIDARSPRAIVLDALPRLGHPAAAVITRPGQATLLPAGVRPLLVPSEAATAVGPQPIVAGERALAIFTAGSTGRPKAVAMSWSALTTRNQELLLDPDEADPAPAALMTPLSYQFGHWRALVPSLGCPVSILEPLALDPAALVERLDRDRMRVVLLVPSLAASLTARWPAGRRLQHVEQLHLFGEALHWEQVPALRAILRPSATIVARYGSSEAFLCMRTVIDAQTPPGSGPVPLGVTVPGVEARLDPVDAADPDGPAEVVVVREEMSLGYLDDPGLTATRFGILPDGRHFWRSGDIATRAPDGQFHRVGRVDDMVKIRGSLVEPSQPQRVLREMPGIRHAIVLPHVDADGTARLVGHVEVDVDADDPPTAGDVRRRLAEAVAPHLVPQVLVRHDRLPLNGVGKIDRAALLAAAPVPWRTAAPRPPADEFERFAASAAGTVLETGDVHPDDDLWELGLDSLSAVELTVILEGAGWTHLEPAHLLDHRTPAALARRRDDTPEPSEVVWLNRHGTRPPLFCIPGGGGTAMAYRWVADALGADQPLMVIEQRGLHSPGRPDRTVQRAAARALAHIRAHLDRHPEQAGEPLVIVGYSAGGVVGYDTATRLERAGQPVRVLLLDAPVGRASGGLTAIANPPAQVARRAAIRAWLRVLPASTLPRERRYRALFLLAGRARVRYTPPAAAFPIALFHPAHSVMPDHWQIAADRLVTIAVAGNHYTMLEPPHASALAGAMADAIAGVRQP